MRYFKTIIAYQAVLDGEALLGEKILYCCTQENFPKNEQLRELFDNLYDGDGKSYLNATWRELREEDIPTDEIHLL